MNKKIKENTLDWLESMQAQGFFDGFEEENANFKNMNDDELEWYFLNWYFTDDFINNLEPNEIHEFYSEELELRNKLLGV